MKARVALLLALGLCTPIGVVYAQTLTYGPIIGRGVTADQMIIKWGTSSASDSTSVGFRVTGAGSFQTASGAASKDHEVVVTGLNLATQYDYYVKSGATQSATSSFSTCPQPGAPMDVVFYGDSRDNPTEHAKIVGQVMAQAPDMVFESGDLVATGAYSLYLSEFFPAVKNLVKQTPFMAAPGNHDANSTLSTNYGLLFPSPRASGSPWLSYYAFSCGNSMFVGLDANMPSDATQKAFLTAQLQAAKSDTSIDHVFVWFHQSAFSPGMHGDDTTVQTEWVPLFDDPANKVHAVFSGHDHIYARLHDSAVGGPVYVVSGGAGAPLYTIGGASAATVDQQVSTYNFVKLHIVGGLVSAVAYDDTGTQLDQFSFGMSTTNPDMGSSGSTDLAGSSGSTDLAGGGPGNGNDGSLMGTSSSGCGVTSGRASSGGFVFALALAGLLLRRRRAIAL